MLSTKIVILISEHWMQPFFFRISLSLWFLFLLQSFLPHILMVCCVPEHRRIVFWERLRIVSHQVHVCMCPFYFLELSVLCVTTCRTLHSFISLILLIWNHKITMCSFRMNASHKVLFFMLSLLIELLQWWTLHWVGHM